MSRLIPRGRSSVRFVLALVTSLALAVGLCAVASARPAPSSYRSQPSARTTSAKPTIVLVHGAFADASGWSAEIQYLTRKGYPVIAPANPLRDLEGDARYIRSVLKSIKGPVVLVGHSYGGAVITNAARGASNVKALVFISAFLPKKGEPAAKFIDPTLFPGSLLSPTTLLIRPTYNPVTRKKDADAYINPADFRAVFAGDQKASVAAVMAAEQRPLTYSAFTTGSGRPAWRSIPSWDLISLNDKAIPPSAQEFMARRAHAHVVAVHSAHDSLISHPGAVERLIIKAAASIK